MMARIGAVLAGLLLLVVIVAGGKLVEFVDSNKIAIIQGVYGNLTFATEAGPWGQWFGSVETFSRREQLWFKIAGKDTANALKIRFNDNGHGWVGGSIAWEMPTDQACLKRIFQKYRTEQNLENQLVKPVVEKAVYATGPMMSSTESAAERRNELLQIIEDQIENGVYLTRVVKLEEEDQITKEKRARNVSEPVKDAAGKVIRAADSPLKDFCIKTYNLTINEVQYDAKVEEQIEQQRKAIMGIRLAMAKSQEAEQDARTAEMTGKANAATAKWEQEKLNATLVATAEGKRKAEEQNAVAMEFYKKAQLAKADADGGYKKALMQADGALDKRLEAYVETQKIWAKSVSDYKGNWVPAITSGGNAGGNGAGSGMETLVNMLSLKTAKDLGFDLGLQPARK